MWPFKKKTNRVNPSNVGEMVDANRRKVTYIVEDAKQSNQHFAEVLEKNGITVKIFLAAGGKRKGKHS